jgi:hypothetical protein
MPSIFAVVRLTTISNFVGCCTRQLRGAGALQNLANIDAGLTICFANACAIANQATSIGILSPGVDCWQGMPDAKGSNLVTSEL